MRSNTAMSEGKGGFFAKTVQKHAGRAKEKILQNLGKADKTTDELFDDYETNFTKQQLNANRLHKEVVNYLRCCRALHGASKSLFETLSEVYEPEWVGHDVLYAQAQNSDMLWTDFCHKLQDQTLAPLTAYTQQFPDIRKKIDKRGRKLVDYDSQRHQLEALQKSTRRDEYKICRGKDQLEAARLTYDALNKELYDEIPSVYDVRIPRVAECLQSLFAAESTFMQESGKISHEIEAIAEKLSRECHRGTYHTKRVVPSSPRQIIVTDNDTSVLTQNATNSPACSDSGKTGDKMASCDETLLENGDQEEAGCIYPVLDDKDVEASDLASTPPPNKPLPLDSFTTSEEVAPSNRPTISSPVALPKEETGRPYEEIEFEDKKVNGTANGEIIGTKVPAGATTDNLPAGVLYRVRATYKYTREDVDELSFEVGEIINVVEYDDPEEQEEGWLCGFKETTSEKGLFPANFTRPI